MSFDAKTCWLVDLGLIPYLAAWELQRRLVEARKAGATPDVLLLCEHPHVITLGRNGKREHLRASDRLLAQMGVEFHVSDRGGDITYHGPGQILAYPILDLSAHRRDVRWYVDMLEETMIRATADFGLAAHRSPANHGVWLPAPSPLGEEKLAALGVHLSRWVASHGFAYNVSTDLRFFDLIVPCGLPGKRATSLERALGRAVPLDHVRERLAARFAEVFGVSLLAVSPRALQETLSSIAPETGPESFPSEALETAAVKGREA